MNSKSAWWLAALLLAGCNHKIVVNGIEVYEEYWQRTCRELQPRASYELGCAPEQLGFSLLRRQGRHPVEVGVQGCGKRALYTRAVLHFYGHATITGWTLSGGIVALDTQMAPPPPPPLAIDPTADGGAIRDVPVDGVDGGAL